MTESPTELRGSEELLKALGAHRRLSGPDLVHLVGLLRNPDFKLIDWHQLGQPGPDWIRVQLHSPPEQVADLVKSVLLSHLNPEIRILTHGIPPLPVFAEVQIEAGAIRTR